MSLQPFSPWGRKAALERMAREEFDLFIIGGGITGAGLARDAALRGLRVALAEKEDFAYGTSSRSSKLVHGGIRYLAQGDVGMVRESARERKVLRTWSTRFTSSSPSTGGRAWPSTARASSSSTASPALRTASGTRCSPPTKCARGRLTSASP